MNGIIAKPLIESVLVVGVVISVSPVFLGKMFNVWLEKCYDDICPRRKPFNRNHKFTVRERTGPTKGRKSILSVKHFENVWMGFRFKWITRITAGSLMHMQGIPPDISTIPFHFFFFFDTFPFMPHIQFVGAACHTLSLSLSHTLGLNAVSLLLLFLFL